jgi:hypothetical protein
VRVTEDELILEQVALRLSSGFHFFCGLYNDTDIMLIIRRGADKSLAFPIFLFAAQPKQFFWDGLKKLEQRNHKCVELRWQYVD